MGEYSSPLIASSSSLKLSDDQIFAYSIIFAAGLQFEAIFYLFWRSFAK
jgi:hypothetical protein